MVERAFAGLELDRHGVSELLPLRRTEHFLDCVHVSRQAGDRQQVPAMAAGDIMHAAVVARALVEADPAGEMGHRLGASPIGIVLMPSDDAAMPRGFAKELIVPESDRAAEQLARGDGKRRMPEDVVKAGTDSPGA